VIRSGENQVLVPRVSVQHRSDDLLSRVRGSEHRVRTVDLRIRSRVDPRVRSKSWLLRRPQVALATIGPRNAHASPRGEHSGASTEARRGASR